MKNYSINELFALRDLGKIPEPPTKEASVLYLKDGHFFKLNGDGKSLPLEPMKGAPSSANASGEIGEMRFDSNYLYICVAKNTWKRTSLSTW